MSGRTEQLLQHGSVEGMIEAALKRVGAGQLRENAFFGDDGLDDPEGVDDDEDDDR